VLIDGRADVVFGSRFLGHTDRVLSHRGRQDAATAAGTGFGNDHRGIRSAARRSFSHRISQPPKSIG
jgi:hypothetical protein